MADRLFLLGGFRLQGCADLTLTIEDWSRVRSPARARRRRRKHKQNISFEQVPDPAVYMVGDLIVAHPTVLQKVIDALQEARPCG